LEDGFPRDIRVEDYRACNRREDCKSWEDLITLEMELLEDYREDSHDEFERYSKGKPNSRPNSTMQALNIESNIFSDGEHTA